MNWLADLDANSDFAPYTSSQVYLPSDILVLCNLFKTALLIVQNILIILKSGSVWALPSKLNKKTEHWKTMTAAFVNCIFYYLTEIIFPPLLSNVISVLNLRIVKEWRKTTLLCQKYIPWELLDISIYFSYLNELSNKKLCEKPMYQYFILYSIIWI